MKGGEFARGLGSIRFKDSSQVKLKLMMIVVIVGKEKFNQTAMRVFLQDR